MLTSKAPAQRHYHSRPLGYPQKADADIADVAHNKRGAVHREQDLPD
jgi:hypothetical protein